jgi:hypothetical protein
LDFWSIGGNGGLRIIKIIRKNYKIRI